MISSDAIRRAEVLAEFSALGAGSMGYGGWSVERRTSQAQKARDRARVVSDVQVARRAEAAAKTPPRPCACCGGPVHRVAHRRGPAPKWCTARCYARWYARGRARTCGLPASVPCERCGGVIHRPAHQRGSPRRFCGARCQARAAATRRRAA